MIWPSLVNAQTSSSRGAAATRADLVRQARIADSLGHTDESFRLHGRLRDGDFEVGDQIVVTFEGLMLKKLDTLVVRAGRTIRLDEPMGDISVAGVLRSEIEPLISAKVAEYYRSEVVHATPLLRLSIEGAVQFPGVYYARTDMTLADFISRNGRQGPNADVSNITIKRGDRVVWGSQDVQSAMVDGLTLEQLDLQPGDAVNVGTNTTANRLTLFLQVGVPILSAVLIPLLLRKR